MKTSAFPKPKSPTGNRKNSPVLLLPKEKEMFNVFAKSKGWSLGQFLRIASTTCILLDTKKAPTYAKALEMASILDMQGKL